MISYGATVSGGASNAGLLTFRKVPGAGTIFNNLPAMHVTSGVPVEFVFPFDCPEIFVTNGAGGALVVHSLAWWYPQ
jgi:hypothetical protein